MLLVLRPDNTAILRFLDGQRYQSFSYLDVGATRAVPPAGYRIDHNRIKLGEGPETFAKAVDALLQWKMFEMGWVSITPNDAPITKGSCVAILVRHFGFWSLNACRIVYLIDEQSPVDRFGFAYGTLPGHVEQGEERFIVEYHPEDHSVWYDLLAFSRPRHVLARFGSAQPLVTKAVRRRFAKSNAGGR